MHLNSALIREAWQVRSRNFPPDVTFHRPSATLPVSLTGAECALQCAHCGGRFLKKMTPWNKFGELLKMREFTSCLISGGCDRQGKVPFRDRVQELKEIKRSAALRFNFHTGLVEEREALLLKGLAEVVSFDFVGSDQTIRDVLGLPASVSDYAASYKALKTHLPVAPHICIGLDGGRLDGEYRALELLAKIGAAELVFLVFIPSPGTRLENKSPPPPEKVAHVLAHARLIFPDIPIHLGCMRPGGRYRRDLDVWALRCGVNRLVMPAPEASAEAERLGLTINYRNECCVL